MKRASFLVLSALVTLVVPARASADAIGLLVRTEPPSFGYTLGGDFVPVYFSAMTVAFGYIQSVDLVLPPGAAPNTSTSGCEVSDFFGFIVGRIALVQRGTCTFDTKVTNAVAAGAAGVLIFNEGQPGRTGLVPVTLLDLAPVPVMFTTFAVGNELASTPGAAVWMMVTDSTLPVAVPEPTSLAMLGAGLGVVALGRRRRRP